MGNYRREPVELPHHLVDVVQLNETTLQWTQGGEEKGWTLTISPEDDSLLLVGEDCPLFDECKTVTIDLEDDLVIGLTFNGVSYLKSETVVGLNDDPFLEGNRGSNEDDSDGAVADGDEFDVGADDASTD